MQYGVTLVQVKANPVIEVATIVVPPPKIEKMHDQLAGFI
jgi:hypothetical protein